VLTIFDDGKEREKVTLSALKTKADMHKMMVEKGFKKKPEVEARTKNDKENTVQVEPHGIGLDEERRREKELGSEKNKEMGQTVDLNNVSHEKMAAQKAELKNQAKERKALVRKRDARLESHGAQTNGWLVFPCLALMLVFFSRGGRMKRRAQRLFGFEARSA